MIEACILNLRQQGAIDEGRAQLFRDTYAELLKSYRGSMADAAAQAKATDDTMAALKAEIELKKRRTALKYSLAPVGMAGMLARRGEVQAARAAARAGVPFTLSSAACCSIEEVAAGTGAPFWYQLYMLKDRGYMAALLQRAAAAGCPALLLTVDTPVLGVRYRDFRAGISQDP